jgi:6-pyruvoyltetrahydropterin/6-carboxytetrahydropterin synthase
MMELSQSFFFDAAHTLARRIEAEGSRRVHGHTYHAEVTVRGEPDPATGMVVDLGVLRARIASVRDQLDHHLLDEVEGVGIPTIENLCRFIAGRLAPALPGLCAVTVERKATGDRCTLRL